MSATPPLPQVSGMEKFAKFIRSPWGIALQAAVYLGFNMSAAMQVSKLDQQLSPQTHQDSPLRFFLPNWYNSFTISKYAPDKTPQNTWMHTLGKLIFPSTYTAVQLSKLKAKSEGKPTSQVAWGTIFLTTPSTYSQQTAKELVEKASTSGLDVTSQSLPTPSVPTVASITQPVSPTPTAMPGASTPYSPVRLA